MADIAPDRTAPDIGAVLRALGDPERRFLLTALRDIGPLSAAALADVLSGWLATRREAGVVGSEERRRVEARLHHVHLPVLEASGLVADRPAGVEVTSLDPPVERVVVAVLDASRAEANRRRRERVDDAR